MGISLSIISGKGGCGKTTLALSIGQLLSKIGCKVLIVDCDLSTHGATYFFEKLLKDKDDVLTVYDVFSNSNEVNIDKKELYINKNMSFIPSATSLIRERIIETKFILNKNVFEKILKKYDIVIYDCQAGFSPLTKEATRIATRNLVVMELDSISASSTRSLSSQLSTNLNGTNTYQVLNKVTDEEFDIYYLVTYGMFHKNLSPIRYSLSVKKAFAFNHLPEIDVKTVFGRDIFENIHFLFPEYEKDLLQIERLSKQELRDSIEEEIEGLTEKEKTEHIKNNKFDYLSFITNLLPMFLSGILLMVSKEMIGSFIYEIFIIFAGVFGGYSLIKIWDLLKRYVNGEMYHESDEILNLQRQLEHIEDDIEDITYKLYECEMNIE